MFLLSSRTDSPALNRLRPVLPLAAALILIVATTHLSAQMPQTISYQGQIQHWDGSPLGDGIYTIRVALYTDGSDTDPIWRESHEAHLAGGVFHIELGSVNPFNLPFDQQYWLSVDVEGSDDGGTRLPLTASPYAIHADVAQRLAGGAVASVNGQQGPLRIVGAGSTVVTEENGTITISSTLPKALQADGKVELSPYGVQSSSDGNTLIHLNEQATGSPDLIDIEVGGSDRFLVTNSGNLTIAGTVSATGAVISGGTNLGDGTGSDGLTVNPGTGSVSFSSARLQNVADPSAAQDAATKAYVDAQDAARNLNGEPLVTFGAGSTKMTDNRVLTAGTGIAISDGGIDDSPLTVSNTGVTSLAGTVNQVTVDQSNGDVTLSLPQDIHTDATPTFDGITLVNMGTNTSSTEVVVSNGGTLETRLTASLAEEFDGDFWTTEGNVGTDPATNYIGTSDATALRMGVNGGTDNSLILNTNRSIQRQRTGLPRGADAVDLQSAHTYVFQVASGNQSVISGGVSNAADADHATVGGGGSNWASAGFSTIGGGEANSVRGHYGTIGGGSNNRVYVNSYATVGGGASNEANSNYSVVGGGLFNRVNRDYGAVVGGADNNASGILSSILGGARLHLTGSGSIGFLSQPSLITIDWRNMVVRESQVAIFGNVDMMLANNDGRARRLRFYEGNGSTGEFPNGVNYTSFQAGSQSQDINYTLPTTLPSASGHLLASTASGQMSWVDPTTAANAWSLDGNTGTTAGTNYVGTGDATDLHLYVNGGTDNSLILNTNGSVQRGIYALARGVDAVDLQIRRSNEDQVAAGQYSVIGGGERNHISTSGSNSTVSGGFSNRIEGASKYATIGGGSINRIEGATFYNTVGGGEGNEIGTKSRSVIAGGKSNRIDAEYSAIAGGSYLTLTGDGSFGFLGNIRQSEVAMSLSEEKIAAFGNTDLLLINNDNQASRIRFYEANSTSGVIPATVNYTSFQAGAQTVNIDYTLPTSAPANDGEVMTSTTGGAMSWSNGLRVDDAAGIVRTGNVYGLAVGDPDTDDDGMLDATGDVTAVPFGTVRYDANTDKGQMFVSDSDGSGTDGWINLH